MFPESLLAHLLISPVETIQVGKIMSYGKALSWALSWLSLVKIFVGLFMWNLVIWFSKAVFHFHCSSFFIKDDFVFL